METIPNDRLAEYREATPDLQSLRALCKRAINSLPPATPGTPVPLDHELDCYVVASAYVLAQRLGLDTPALTVGGAA